MDSNKVQQILDKIKDVKIAVYGDHCLDAYWILDPDGGEISVETGLKTQVVDHHYYSLGGASNIIANLAALKPAYIQAIGVIGNDIFGTELIRQLKGIGVDTSSIVIQNENFNTMTYVKRYVNSIEEPRVDFGFFNKRSPKTNKELLSHIRGALENCDVLIFNQQVQGSIDDEFISEANELFDLYNNKIVIFDSRHFGNRFNNIYRKVNQIEIALLNNDELHDNDIISHAKLETYSKNLFSLSGKPVFVTCGPFGIAVYDKNGLQSVPGIQLLNKLDTVGAGDTVTSAISLCLGAKISSIEAAEFANLAAAVTVQKLFQTGTASPEEVKEISSDPDYIYQPYLANDIRQAKYLDESEIEVCCENIPDFKNIEHIVFDNDGTISTLRQGWEQIMEPVMVKAILGDHYQTSDESLYHKVLNRVREYIFKSTGIETLVQMEALVEIIKEFGIVSQSQILDKFGYKKIYNDALMKVVNQRIEKFKRGELSIDDFTIKGSISFLKALNRKGVKLYLVSGTDEEDVKEEVDTLGYADLFTGGIYGALNDTKTSTKKRVIRRIITENKLDESKMAAVGDGPVELRESVKVNGIAVGVASDEVRRYGLNAEKRVRLIKAGAHIVIPDFSDTGNLWKLFGCKK